MEDSVVSSEVLTAEDGLSPSVPELEADLVRPDRLPAALDSLLAALGDSEGGGGQSMSLPKERLALVAGASWSDGSRPWFSLWLPSLPAPSCKVSVCRGLHGLIPPGISVGAAERWLNCGCCGTAAAWNRRAAGLHDTAEDGVLAAG